MKCLALLKVIRIYLESDLWGIRWWQTTESKGCMVYGNKYGVWKQNMETNQMAINAE